MSVAYHQAQKQRYRITLELNVLADFDPHQIDWEKLFKLEPSERVEAYVEDLDCPSKWQKRTFSFVNITPPKYPSYVNKTMRPLKYKNLGEMSIIRVPQSVIKILPHLQDVMQQLEENDRDSVEVIVAALDNIQDGLS